MSLTVPLRSTNHASPSSGAESAGTGRRSTPPTAIQLLLPVWGERFVRQFLDFGLPTLLAPGNLPALASMLPCEFVILTSEDDEPLIRLHPNFRALSRICPPQIRLIDHLITGRNYSTTLTLAYAEAIRGTGAALDTCFLILLSDYVMADGSLAHVMARMMKGASGVLAGNFQVAAEDALPWLREQINRSTPALALSPRELMRWGFANLHPATVANTVNFPLNHNRHTNRLFWRVDGQTLIGRFYLIHPIAVRPETMSFIIGSSCDYSFVPEMCPSGNVDVITDSDEFLVVEMQPRAHEAAFLRPGPLRPRALAKTLSEWTTQYHRQNVHHSIVFHASNLAGDHPETLDTTIAEADRFIAEVERLMRRKPQPYRDHPYWLGALAAHHEATGRSLRLHDQWLALGLPESSLTKFEHPFGKWLLETLVYIAVGRPPLMRPWHPRWVDHALILEHLREVVRDPRERLLMIAERPTPFTVSFADGDEHVVSLRKMLFLGSRPDVYEPLVRSFDLCLIELTEAELAQSDELIDRVVPLMKPNAQILVVVYNDRRKDGAGFTASIGFHSTRLMRAGATLGEVRIVPASWFRWQVSRASERLAVTAYHRPWLGLPLMAVTGGFLAIGSLLANAVARGRSLRALRPNRLATSFHMVLNVDASSQEAHRYAAGRIVRQAQRRRLGIVDGPVRQNVLARRPDTTPILRGTRRSGEQPAPVGASDGGADGQRSASRAITGDMSATANKDATREPQYQRLIDLRDEIGLTPLGLMTNQVWHDDPRRLGILLSRYKFVAKMLSGRRDVGEVGCGDAFGTPVVLQEVQSVTVYDFDPVFIADIHQRFSERWPIVASLHDIVAAPLPKQHDGLYSLDVLEHIPPHDEDAYLTHLCGSLTDDGVLIIGSPSIESQVYASPQSKAGHVNCKSGAELKVLLGRYFKNVFLFSMNDEVVHTGFYPMAHYLLAVCSGKK